MGQRQPVTVSFRGSTKTLYYDPETKKTYVDATSSAQPGSMWRIQVEKKMNPTASTESQTTLPTTAAEWAELGRQQGLKYGNPTLTRQEAYQRGLINLTPNERGQYFYNGFANLPVSTQQTTTSQGTQSNQGPSGQVQIVKGPDGRWTYKLIGQVPTAQMKAAIEQVRKLNEKLDAQQTTPEQTTPQQNTPSKFSNLRDTSAIQRFLTMQGYKLEIDGKMGPKTQQALRDWQAKNGLKNDGLWGRATEAAAKQAESTMMQPIGAPQITGVDVRSTMPASATAVKPSTFAPTDLLSTIGTYNPSFAKYTAMDVESQLGPQAMVNMEATQYQKSGGCMYKRGKRVK